MDLNFLILLLYCNRPVLVKNALQSIAESTYDNYEVAVIDDSPECPIRPTIEQHFPQLLPKCKFYETNDSKESKLARGNSIFGQFMNQAIEESDADVGIMLCDDDALFPTYLENLNTYYQQNSEVMYAYSHLICYNPEVETYENIKHRTETSIFLNWQHPINPWCQVDSSQVSWRISCNKEGNCWFPYPQTTNLDASFYARLFEIYRECVWTGFIGQFKGQFPKQLGARGSYFENFE